MKNSILIILIMVFSISLTFTSCEDEDKTFFQSEAIVNAGGYLLTLDFPANGFDLNDLENSTFEVTVEAHDYTSDSSKLGSVDVMVSLNGTGVSEDESFLMNIPAASFTTNDNDYPEYTINSPALDALNALSLNVGDISSSDFMYYRLILNLTDGTSFSVDDINDDLVGEVFFDSDFFYEANF